VVYFTEIQIPNLQLTPVNSSMWKIPAGSIVCLDDGNTVFFHFDGYCYKNDIVQQASAEEVNDLTSFLNLLSDNDDI